MLHCTTSVQHQCSLLIKSENLLFIFFNGTDLVFQTMTSGKSIDNSTDLVFQTMTSGKSIESCSVGQHIHSLCFLSQYVKGNSELYTLADLDEDTRLTIHFRTNMKNIPSICLHHRTVYTTRFKSFKKSKKCDNPFENHLKSKRPLGNTIVPFSSCVKVSLKNDNLHIYPGQRLCMRITMRTQRIQ